MVAYGTCDQLQDLVRMPPRGSAPSPAATPITQDPSSLDNSASINLDDEDYFDVDDDDNLDINQEDWDAMEDQD